MSRDPAPQAGSLSPIHPRSRRVSSSLLMGTFALQQVATAFAKGQADMPEVDGSNLGGFGLTVKDFTDNAKTIVVSLLIGLAAALINLVIGVFYGAISAIMGGRVDAIMQRIIEVLVGIPSLIIVILFMLVLPPGVGTIIISLSITGWVNMARLVRAQILKLKSQEFVLAAQLLGSSKWKIILKHLIPNCISVVIISTALQIPNAIFTESYLSFLGLGVNAPMPSLGSLASDALNGLSSYPFRLVIPAVVISLIVLSLNLFGDGLRDAFDPKLRT